MDKEFSEGFMRDLADLLDICEKDKTDNVELTFDTERAILTVDFSFKIEKK